MNEPGQGPEEPVPFNASDPLARKWTDRALELLLSGDLSAQIVAVEGIRVARMEGTCPYCGDVLHITVPLKAVTEGTEGVRGRGLTDGTEFGDAAGEARYEELTATCGCDVMHPGNPSKSAGCGTSFRIKMRVG